MLKRSWGWLHASIEFVFFFVRLSLFPLCSISKIYWICCFPSHSDRWPCRVQSYGKYVFIASFIVIVCSKRHNCCEREVEKTTPTTARISFLYFHFSNLSFCTLFFIGFLVCACECVRLLLPWMCEFRSLGMNLACVNRKVNGFACYR